jgi:hypothetical protein
MRTIVKIFFIVFLVKKLDIYQYVGGMSREIA